MWQKELKLSEVAQSCLNLCNPKNYTVDEILQARILAVTVKSESESHSVVSNSLRTHELYSSVQSLSCIQLFATQWIAALQASLSTTNSRSSLKLTSIESVMPPSHLILCRPLLLLPPIPPSIRVFSSESTVPMRWPKYWSFRFSIISFKKKSQGWSPSEWIGWISSQSKGFSRVFSNTTVQKHQFFGAQLSSQTNYHIHTWLLEKPQPWLDGACWQSNVSAFEYAI